MKYTKAPISEVILGITLKSPIGNTSDIISFYTENLKKEYKTFELSNPIGEFIIDDIGRVRSHLNPNNSGQALFRFRTLDKKYLIQIQKNKIYLNWIRNDQESVGHYPGFNILYKRFNDLLKRYTASFSIQEDEILACDLTYHDRFDLDEILNVGIGIQNVLRSDLISYNDKLLNFSYKIAERNQSSDYFINTTIETVFKERSRLLRFEHIIQSIDKLTKNYKTWFDEAHIIQFKSFEKTFSDEVLKLWE